jgi:hypothetical protein
MIANYSYSRTKLVWDATEVISSQVAILKSVLTLIRNAIVISQSEKNVDRIS